jgi:hypothetical protein
MLFILDLDAGGWLTHWWWTAFPTRLEHRRPCLDGVMAQHPSPRLGNWIVGWSPVKRPQDHPLRMNRWDVGFELNKFVLIDLPTKPHTHTSPSAMAVFLLFAAHSTTAGNTSSSHDWTNDLRHPHSVRDLLEKHLILHVFGFLHNAC